VIARNNSITPSYQDRPVSITPSYQDRPVSITPSYQDRPVSITPSYRRMPVSRKSAAIDTGLRRYDGVSATGLRGHDGNGLIRFATIVLVLLMLAACSAGVPAPEDRFYEISPASPAVQQQPALTGGLSIAHVEADPLRNGRAILYRHTDKPLQLGRYHYEFWADQPPRMIQQALLESLRQSGVADRVETEGRRPHFRYELVVRVLRFESLVESRRALADVELEAVLHSARDGRPLWTKVYHQQTASRSGDMHALADAMQQGLEQIFGQLIEDLKATDAGNE